ncbi:hypothetical protein MPTK2_1g13930 [Marchantia polymorpha subsp. ruderalis]
MTCVISYTSSTSKQDFAGASASYQNLGGVSRGFNSGCTVRFHLFKENKNTQDALMIIGRMLEVKPKS